jgi:class 3 adenylate cyclase
LVVGQRPKTRAGRAAAAPASYTPKHLAEKILASRSAVEGERKRVTVLFADVKGSMELAEQLGPEEWHGVLDRFFQILAVACRRGRASWSTLRRSPACAATSPSWPWPWCSAHSGVG